MGVVRWTCYIFSGILMLIALAMILWLDDKSIGIFAALIAAVLARILTINVAGQLESAQTERSEQTEPDAGSDPSR